MNHHSIITYVMVCAGSLVLSLGLFLVLREVVAWYWKINEALELLVKIEENTRK